MQAGRRGLLRRAATRHIGASGPRFPSLFDVGREYSRAAKHVDSCDERLSDAGSTPAASTSPSLGNRCIQPRFPYRLQTISTPEHRLVQQPNGVLDHRGTDVHVPLCRRQVLVPGQSLDGPRRRPTHRQVRAEGVAQDVTPGRTLASCAARRTWSCTIFCVMAELLKVGVELSRASVAKYMARHRRP